MDNVKAFELLCRLCSPNMDNNIAHLSGSDWKAVWKQALRHRVVPVMAEQIRQWGIVVPENIAQRITAHNRINLHKGLQQAAELIRLTRLFQEHDIPFVAFKGIALIKLTGLELHQRHHGDMDILLASPEYIERADMLLSDAGYQRSTLPKGLALNGPGKQHFLNYEKDVVYFHPQRKIRLELHFKLFLSDNLLPAPVADIYKNKAEIQINDVSIPVMSKTDHQLYLLGHGSVSCWFRLKWLCDIPLISDNGVDYLSPDFFGIAQSLGFERIVTQGLALSGDLLAMPLSAEVKRFRQQSLIVRFLIRDARQQLLGQEFYTRGLSGKLLFWFKFTLGYMPLLRKDFSYKREHIKSYLIRISDWEVIELPASLFWLYYPLRPFLWLKRQCR